MAMTVVFDFSSWAVPKVGGLRQPLFYDYCFCFSIRLSHLFNLDLTHRDLWASVISKRSLKVRSKLNITFGSLRWRDSTDFESYLDRIKVDLVVDANLVRPDRTRSELIKRDRSLARVCTLRNLILISPPTKAEGCSWKLWMCTMLPIVAVSGVKNEICDLISRSWSQRNERDPSS